MPGIARFVDETHTRLRARIAARQRVKQAVEIDRNHEVPFLGMREPSPRRLDP